jgi:hypothetical protein
VNYDLLRLGVALAALAPKRLPRGSRRIDLLL